MESSDSSRARQSVAVRDGTDHSLPLNGAVICCTSVPDEKRTELASHAVQMGAVHRYDLTLDVTHLIVGDYDTPKYRYVAKERPDVRSMTTRWIEAVRELWINDQDIDMEMLDREHTLPTFHSLRFSMTGCDDPTERQEIADQVRANGAAYEGDLTKHITHLISFRTEGAKYRAARTWGLRIVSIEWFRDSLERGMILDEKLYDPSLPEEERGRGAWDRTKPKRQTLGKRTRDGSTLGLEESKRKLRRTASTKLSSQNGKIWGDIVGGGMVAQVSRSGQWDSDNNIPPGEDTCHTRTEREKDGNSEVLHVAAGPKSPLKGIFSDCRFYLFGFSPARIKVLSAHLLPHDAGISETLDDLQNIPQSASPSQRYMIVPHDLASSKHPLLGKSQLDVETITEWWVERCLHHKKFMRPQEHVIGRPFPVFPIKAFHDITISSAAFTGIDLLHVKKAVELLGAKYSEDMTPQSSILLTKSVLGLRKDKLQHAQQWKIPIINASWLWDSIEAGTRLPMQKYRFRAAHGSGSPVICIDADLRPNERHQMERSKSKGIQPSSRTNNHALGSITKPHLGLRAGDAAATSEEPVDIKDQGSDNFSSLANASHSATLDRSHKEPLGEISPNSPSRTVSTAPAPSDHPAPRPDEDISNAITNLLAKTKTAAQPMPVETAERGRRKRGVQRILGRATSNVSAASANVSRATSVDSTATHGHAVEYPPQAHSGTTGSGSSGPALQMERFMNGGNGDRNMEGDFDTQPPATQLQYDDPESKEYEERVMARMMGEKVDKRRAGFVKEKAATLGDFMERSRTTRSARERV